MHLSLTEAYKDKNLLILGGLGFLGKMVLVLFLEKLPVFKRIYLVLRPKQSVSAQERFVEALCTSPVFESLRQKLGDHFLEEVSKKVCVIEGDLSRADFGIESEIILSSLYREVDLVINAAGLVSFHPKFLDAWNANVQGAIHAAQFVQKTSKAALLHVSTCYVSGNASGVMPEELHPDRSPSGRSLDVFQELEQIQKWIQTIKDTEGLKKKAQDRATFLGWPNIYAYTKALSEAWIVRQPNLSVAIFRPAILESTIVFPFPGWNEGFNTSAPLLKCSENGLPIAIANPDFIVDIIPVDICCIHLVKVGAALLKREHRPVYQSASSRRNPLFVGQMLKFMRKRHRMNLKQGKKVPLLSWIGFQFEIITIGPNHPLSCFTLYRLLSKLPQRGWIKNWAYSMQNFCRIVGTFLPYLYETRVMYESNLVDEISVIESGWNQSVDQIDWEDYWVNIQMPAVAKWCYPYS